MGHQDDGNLLFAIESGEERHDLIAGLAVEVAGRFVCEDQPGVVGQCPGDGDSLLLSARELIRQAMAEAIAGGDTFIIAAGCDKRFATCRDRFANVANFRGFPHIPGNDFVIAAPDAGAGNDGSSMAGTGAWSA